MENSFLVLNDIFIHFIDFIQDQHIAAFYCEFERTKPFRSYSALRKVAVSSLEICLVTNIRAN